MDYSAFPFKLQLPPPSASTQQFYYSQHEELVALWVKLMQEVAETRDFKYHNLPLTRIRKMMQADESVRMISAETIVVFSKACELFIHELTMRSWMQAPKPKRSLKKSDIHQSLLRTQVFDFLVDIATRDHHPEIGGVIPKENTDLHPTPHEYYNHQNGDMNMMMDQPCIDPSALYMMMDHQPNSRNNPFSPPPPDPSALCMMTGLQLPNYSYDPFSPSTLCMMGGDQQPNLYSYNPVSPPPPPPPPVPCALNNMTGQQLNYNNPFSPNSPDPCNSLYTNMDQQPNYSNNQFSPSPGLSAALYTMNMDQQPNDCNNPLSPSLDFFGLDGMMMNMGQQPNYSSSNPLSPSLDPFPLYMIDQQPNYTHNNPLPHPDVFPEEELQQQESPDNATIV